MKRAILVAAGLLLVVSSAGPARSDESERAMGETSSVEALLQQVAMVDPTAADFSLWVADQLTYSGHPVQSDAAMAIVLDAILAKGFMPAGFRRGSGGRTYLYHRAS